MRTLDRVLLAIFFVSFVLSFAPLFFSLQTSKTTELSPNWLKSSEVTLSYACDLFVCFPMLIDLLLDMSFQTPGGNILFYERILILSGSMYPTVVFGLVSLPSVPLYVASDIMLCIKISQHIWLALPFILILRKTQSSVWTKQRTTLLGLFWCLIQLTYQLALRDGLLGRVFLGLWALFSLCFYFPIILFYVLYGYYCICSFNSFSMEEYVTMTCTIFSSFFVILAAFRGLRQMVDFLPVANYLIAIFAVVATLLPGRVARRLYGETEKELNVKQSFIRYISHELRTPLNVATMGLSMLKNSLQHDGALDEERSDLFTEMNVAITAAMDILHDILTYDRIVSSLLRLQTSPQPVIAFVRDTLKVFAMQAEMSGLMFHLPDENDPSLASLVSRTVSIDVHKMAQVLRNVASNALKFTPPPGTVTIRLTKLLRPSEVAVVPLVLEELSNRLDSFPLIQSRNSSSKASTEWVRLEFIDSGVGIAPENLPKLFKEVIQFNANELQDGKGTGLGLFIAKGLVELHGGTISAKSDGVGQGCCVSIELPLDPVSTGLNEVPPATIPMVNGSPSCRSDDQFDQTVDSLPRPKPSAARRNFMGAITKRPFYVVPGDCDGNEASGRFSPGAASLETTMERTTSINSISIRRRLNSDEVSITDRHIANDLRGSVSSSSRDNAVPEMSSQRTFEPLDFTTVGELMKKADAKDKPREMDHDHDHISSVRKADDEACMEDSMEKLLPSQRVKLASCNDSPTLLKTSSVLADLPSNNDWLRGKRVLCVDDSLVNLKMTSLLFKKLGAVCSQAADGHLAVEMVRESLEGNGSIPPFDMIVMDNLMPTMNGPEACAAMRAMGFRNPIFGLTGHALEADIRRYKAMGATEVFLKPLDVSAFKSQATQRML